MRSRSASSVFTTVLGALGAWSQTACISSISEVDVRRYGPAPVTSRYSSTPSAYTSDAVVIGSPRICSGLALSGVTRRSNVASAGVSVSRIFAMPKSRSFGIPSAVTRMFDALMSRWTISRWCA